MTKLKINTKSFESIPQQHRNLDLDPYVTDPNWMKQLVRLCNPTTRQDFDRHVGPNSNYALKHILLRSLKFHYAVLSGALKDVNPAFNITADQKTALIAKIREGIDACSPGYQARIDSLLEGYFLPKTVGDLLKLVRYNIVERAANKVTNEVHANNRFFIVAKEMGFGVQPKLTDDPHVGAIPEHRIRALLRKAFYDNFQPFSTLLELKTLIMFGFYEYSGRKKEGYPLAVYGPALEHFKTLFQERAVDYNYLIQDEETDVVCDFNWNLILGKLWTVLIEDNYFGNFSVSNLLYDRLRIPKNLTYWLKSTTDRAVEAVSPIFIDPANASADNLALVHHLFKNPDECFAYLHCNPDLSKTAKLTVLFTSLKHLLLENNVDSLRITDRFWQFAFDNGELTDAYVLAYQQNYPDMIKNIKEACSRNRLSLVNLIIDSSLQDLKSLSLKLRHLPPESIKFILNQADERTLFDVFLKSQPDPKVMLSFIQLMSFMGARELAAAFQYKTPSGNSILSIALSKTGKGHVEVVHKLLHFVLTLSPTDQFYVLQLHMAPTAENPLLLAIEKCPSAVPFILNMILNFEHKYQNNITSNYLLNPIFRNKRQLCFRRLLELNQRVNALATQPNMKLAYEAAIGLQTNLIQSLNTYFENKENPEALATLKTTWTGAITTARVHLDGVSDWTTFLKNLALVVMSIPLAGAPLLVNLAVNYFCYGYYNQFFFKPEQARGLDDLTEVTEDRLLACRS